MSTSVKRVSAFFLLPGDIIIEGGIHPIQYEVLEVTKVTVTTITFKVKSLLSPTSYRTFDRKKLVFAIISGNRGTQSKVFDVEDVRSSWDWDPNDSRQYQEYYYRKKQRSKKSSRKKKVSVEPPLDSKIIGWYETLGTRPGVTLNQLTKLYRRLALKYHPDRCKKESSEEQFKRINEAYSNLKTLLKKRPLHKKKVL